MAKTLSRTVNDSLADHVHFIPTLSNVTAISQTCDYSNLNTLKYSVLPLHWSHFKHSTVHVAIVLNSADVEHIIAWHWTAQHICPFSESLPVSDRSIRNTKRNTQVEKQPYDRCKRSVSHCVLLGNKFLKNNPSPAPFN